MTFKEWLKEPYYKNWKKNKIIHPVISGYYFIILTILIIILISTCFISGCVTEQGRRGATGIQGIQGIEGKMNQTPNMTTGMSFDNGSFAFLKGRASGQDLAGGNGANEDLILNGTSHPTKTTSYVIIQPKGGFTGVNTSNPITELQVNGIIDALNFHGYNDNTSIGNYAGYQNTGNYQTTQGYYAGRSNTGNYQTTQGYYAGYQNTGLYQTAVGSSAGRSNTGTSQIALGYSAGRQNIGLYQAVLGYYAGYSNLGDYQTAIGYQAGYNNTGSNTVFIGYGAGKRNDISNIFQLNQSNINLKSLISGNFTSGLVRFSNYGAGTATFDAGGNITPVSDEKYKTAITPFTNGLIAILNINPICWKYNSVSGLDSANWYCGPGTAQDLKKSIPQSVYSKPDVKYEQQLIKKATELEKAQGIEDEYITITIPLGTNTLSVDNGVITATLINAIKEQQIIIDKQQLQINNLISRIEILEIKVK